MNKRLINEYSSYKKYINNSSIESIDYIPPVQIKEEYILNLYNIKNIEDIENIFLENDVINIYNLERVLNCWIIYNFSSLKKDISPLIYILTKYNEVYKFNKYLTKNNIKSFVKKWIHNKNINNFEFNLIKDYYIYFHLEI